MKRLFSVFLVIALMLTMAVPCFAASEEDTRTTTGVTYDSTSATDYDEAGNRFRMTGYVSMSGYRAIVHTEYEILNYAGGTGTAGLSGTTQYVGAYASVVFSDGTTPNDYTLSGNTTTTYYYHVDYTFTGRISSIACENYLWADACGVRTDISGNTYVWVS